MSRLRYIITIAILLGAIVLLYVVLLPDLIASVTNPNHKYFWEESEPTTQETELIAPQTTAPEPGDEPQTPTPELIERETSEFFPKELKGRVPQYELDEEQDPRNCPDLATPYDECFFVKTEAKNGRSLVLIVQDIVRSDVRNEKYEWAIPEVVWVQFYDPSPPVRGMLAEAYVLQDDALADEVMSEDELRSATIINGVYLFRY